MTFERKYERDRNKRFSFKSRSGASEDSTIGDDIYDVRSGTGNG